MLLLTVCVEGGEGSLGGECQVPVPPLSETPQGKHTQLLTVTHVYSIYWKVGGMGVWGEREDDDDLEGERRLSAHLERRKMQANPQQRGG